MNIKKTASVLLSFFKKHKYFLIRSIASIILLCCIFWEKIKFAWYIILGFTIICFWLLPIKVEISENAAREDAKRELISTCEMKKWDVNAFRLVEIKHGDEYDKMQWIFDYQSTTKPKNMIYITIGKNGRIEASIWDGNRDNDPE